jgi:quinol-cytochrome oxidoreductase complex cytochrome b subunit
MSILIRQLHRWLAIIFTLGVIANTVVIFILSKGQQPPTWMYLFALIPLFLLLGSGLYLFVLPYVVRRR